MTAPSARGAPPAREPVAEFASLGVTAFTTTRVQGDFSLAAPELVDANAERWRALQRSLAPMSDGLVSARQVHGTAIAEHTSTAAGWLRLDGFDAHLMRAAKAAAAVTVADCVPAFIAHPSGVVALVHAGWRGIAARLLGQVVQRLVDGGLDAGDLRVHLGPAICGRCYEVGPDVYEQLTGWQTIRHRHVDLRALLVEQARLAGVRHVSVTGHCTRCDNELFFSHRAGDAGRQVSVIVSTTEVARN